MANCSPLNSRSCSTWKEQNRNNAVSERYLQEASGRRFCQTSEGKFSHALGIRSRFPGVGIDYKPRSDAAQGGDGGCQPAIQVTGNLSRGIESTRRISLIGVDAVQGFSESNKMDTNSNGPLILSLCLGRMKRNSQLGLIHLPRRRWPCTRIYVLWNARNNGSRRFCLHSYIHVLAIKKASKMMDGGVGSLRLLCLEIK